jgi:hypothetical protein
MQVRLKPSVETDTTEYKKRNISHGQIERSRLVTREIHEKRPEYFIVGSTTENDQVFHFLSFD